MKIKIRRAKQRRSLGGERIFTQGPQNSNTLVLAGENFYPDFVQNNMLHTNTQRALERFERPL